MQNIQNILAREFSSGFISVSNDAIAEVTSGLILPGDNNSSMIDTLGLAIFPGFTVSDGKRVYVGDKPTLSKTLPIKYMIKDLGHTMMVGGTDKAKSSAFADIYREIYWLPGNVKLALLLKAFSKAAEKTSFGLSAQESIYLSICAVSSFTKESGFNTMAAEGWRPTYTKGKNNFGVGSYVEDRKYPGGEQTHSGTGLQQWTADRTLKFNSFMKGVYNPNFGMDTYGLYSNLVAQCALVLYECINHSTFAKVLYDNSSNFEKVFAYYIWMQRGFGLLKGETRATANSKVKKLVADRGNALKKYFDIPFDIEKAQGYIR